jgi:hypothetical protein
MQKAALCMSLILILCGGLAACSSQTVQPDQVAFQAHFESVENMDDLQGFGGEGASIEHVIEEEDLEQFVMLTIEWDTEVRAKDRFEFFVSEPEEWQYFSYRGREITYHGRDTQVSDLIQEHEQLLGWAHEPPFALPFRIEDLSSGSLTLLYEDVSGQDLSLKAAEVDVYVGFIGSDHTWAVEVPVDDQALQ